MSILFWNLFINKSNFLKHKHLNFICVAGFGYSGSGAVIDLLKEFDQHFVFEKEFRLIKDPDGIIDLENALVKNWGELRSDIAIRRFIDLINIVGRKQKLFSEIGFNFNEDYNKNFFDCCEKYIDNLVDIEWKGDWPYHLHELSWIKLFMYRIKRRLRWKPDLNDTMYFSSPGKGFYEMTRSFLDKLFLTIIDLEKYNTVVLDQALPPYNPQRYLRYFNNVKVIVVDRDPRDIYLELTSYSSYPTNPENNFIEYFKTQRDAIIETVNMDQILRLNFENLVFDYEKELNKIYSFLKLSAKDHTSKQTNFDPAQSAKNVGIWKRMEDSEKIKLIEQELKDYLYTN